MARKTHPQVDFAVEDARGDERVFKTFAEAAGFAVSLAVSDGRTYNIDVLIWDRKGAAWYGGEDAVDRYDEDPDASVFERVAVDADYIGRVP